MTLEHKSNKRISQGFEATSPGHDFLASANIVLPQATQFGSHFSRGGLPHEACCSADVDSTGDWLAGGDGWPVRPQQYCSDVYRERQELCLPPADVSSPADCQEQDLLLYKKGGD